METAFQIMCHVCILSLFNVKYGHQRKLNYTSILSVELIAKTPKSVVTSLGQSPVGYCLATTIF